LFDEQECPVFDFLGQLNKFETDLKRVLNVIGSHELLDYYTELYGTSSDDPNKTKNNFIRYRASSTSFGTREKKKRQEVQNNSSSSDGTNALYAVYHPYNNSSSSSSSSSSNLLLQNAVAEEYEQDFRLLGYDSTTIP